MAGTTISTPSGRGHRASAEVNVTPFVDVMLVLLIIFMVAAPLATNAVPLNLSRPDGPPVTVEPVFVSLQDNGTINIGTQKTGEIAANWQTLQAALREKAGGDFTRQVLVRADHKVPYAEVMRLMDELRRSGYRNMTIVTEDVID
jgi:biopolymer transport protein ExbD